MRCPFCNSEDTKVIDSRAFPENNSIKRRRECNSCEKRFTTYERIEENPIYVVKKNKSRERFNKEKLLRGLERATNKRNISRDDLEKFIAEVEKVIQNTLKNEITTQELGELVLEKLKNLDEVAYVRFASVYKEFDDIKSFIDTVEDIKKDKKI
ncbi:transcriptional repressor NrdR [Cetobacterium sp. 8H]|uniref:transcriptional regulator NrdR n=1 Tax=Cetobacterium sp. 8H TaxID=2759681 RepID=UPI00163C4B3E|nr:transcriptional regulator NrdR [Cetobacterium sp. 8H]MBC2850560.1 transcriptional repressor NrdR [Cetobacterium sp. 8H]